MKIPEADHTVPSMIQKAAWILCLLAFALPFCRIVVNGDGFFQFLLTNYAGIIAFVVVLLLATAQGLIYYLQKKWVSWPGLVAGIYLLLLSINLARQIFSGFGNTGLNGPENASRITNTPMPGLFVLALGAGMLFVISVLQLIRKSRGRSFNSPMNS